MYDTSHILEHHGVKGQKWGVRRYKKLRSEGARYTRAADTEQRAAKKATKRAKLTKGTKYEKQYTREANSHTREANRMSHKAETKISQASKLPVTIQRHNAAAIGKIAGRDALHVGLAWNAGVAANKMTRLVTHNSGIAAVAGAGTTAHFAKGSYTKRTAKDRFDESVQRKQKG